MNILLTGGAGFIASHLADALIAKGHHVVIVDNLSSGKAEFVNPQATFYNLDITDPQLEDIFRRHKPQVVNHHAAQKEVTKSIQQPLFDAQVNILGTLNLLENCAKHGVRKFIFASSGGTVYGEPLSLPVSEDHPQRPSSPYGISKLTAEHYLRFYHEVRGINCVALRYSNVYGPRQDPYGEAGVIAIFCLRLLRGEPTVIYGDGDQVRDFVFIEDVVAANLAALESASAEPLVVNVGTGVPTSVNVLLRKLTSLLGYGFSPTYKPAKPGEIRTTYLDIARAHSLLGWSPRVSLEDGLRKTIESFMEPSSAAK